MLLIYSTCSEGHQDFVCLKRPLIDPPSLAGVCWSDASFLIRDIGVGGGLHPLLTCSFCGTQTHMLSQ